MIKVGALRPFSTRSQLLSVMDRIMGLSTGLHNARDVGQMSLFGEATGVSLTAEDTLLPSLSRADEVPAKTVLAWEKELVGVYISEHPLAQALTRLQDVVNAYVGALQEEANGQQVTVVGMVQRVRRHLTKKGAEMAFVTLEDLQGTCDVVVFPQTWNQTKELWQPEGILVVAGKVDAGRRDTPSLLCDWAKVPDEVATPADVGRRQAALPPPPPPPPPVPPPVHIVRVTLTRSGEQTADVQTLRKVHNLLAGHPGQDRFTIRLIGGTNRPVELAFPNDTTRYDAELAQQLKAMLGPDALYVS